MSDDTFTQRLEATGHRLDQLRPGIDAGAPWPLADRFDHDPEASWGPMELLAHVAEMLPYWLGEVERILAGPAEPVPFGRVGSDPVRIALIGRDRALADRGAVRADRLVARALGPSPGLAHAGPAGQASACIRASAR